MSLPDSLRAIALAAVSEPGRADREVARQACEDLDELAARRKRNEVDRYPTRATWEAEALEDQAAREQGPF